MKNNIYILATFAFLFCIEASLAQVYNIYTEEFFKDDIPMRWQRPDGQRWGNYRALTNFHYIDGWRNVFEAPWCEEGYVVANKTPNLIDDVVHFSWDCEPMPIEVPNVVTKFRFWLAFNAATGLTPRDVNAVISTWEEGPERDQAEIALDSARDYRRSNPFVEVLRIEAGMTEEQMDQIFIAASELEID